MRKQSFARDCFFTMGLDFVSFVFDWREDVLEELEGMFEIK